MRVHFDVLGWLYILSGIFGLLTAASLGVLAFGTTAALAEIGALSLPTPPTVWLLLFTAIAFGAGGVLMIGAGRGVVRRGRFGRGAALVLAVPNLFIVPFGTVLGIYTFWTLLNDEARREFGRPPRSIV